MKHILFLLSSVVAPLAFASGDGYLYQNCADQRLRLPLRECASISISQDLSTIEVRDTGEDGISVGDPTGVFHVLNSSNVPLAVPVEGYRSSDRWEYGSNIYLKISRGETRYFGWQRQPADTIAVVPVSARKDGDFGDMSYVAKHTRLVFWYSETDGITAIAYPALGRQSGEVFYCANTPCLFAQKS
jgi:hypothetical protein